MLWVAPVVSGLGLTAAHADSTSGTTSPPPPNSPPPPPNSPPPPPNSPPPPPNSPPPPPAGVEAVTLTNSPPQGVLGETFTNQPPADGGTPSAVLPFTGAAAPIKSATLIGAGLVVSGAAAIAASRNRPQPAAHASRHRSQPGAQASDAPTTNESDADE